MRAARDNDGEAERAREPCLLLPLPVKDIACGIIITTTAAAVLLLTASRTRKSSYVLESDDDSAAVLTKLHSTRCFN